MTGSLNYKHSAFAQAMLESIRCGKYTAGMRILSERDLSERFSVSRNTVREGLAQLFDMQILVLLVFLFLRRSSRLYMVH